VVSACLRDKRLNSREESLSPFTRLTATIDWYTGSFSDRLLGSNGGTHAEILKNIRQEEPGYPSGNLTNYLREFLSPKRGEILRFDPVAGKYFFRDPLYLAYAQCLFVPPKQSTAKLSVTLLGMTFTIDGDLHEWKSLQTEWSKRRQVNT
jgi:hypothetical protein